MKGHAHWLREDGRALKSTQRICGKAYRMTSTSRIEESAVRLSCPERRAQQFEAILLKQGN